MKILAIITGAFLIMLVSLPMVYACGPCAACEARAASEKTAKFCGVAEKGDRALSYREGVDIEELSYREGVDIDELSYREGVDIEELSYREGIDIDELNFREGIAVEEL